MPERRRRGDDKPFYLVSSAGIPNYGDEFITRAWLDWLARNHPRVPVWLDCLEPGRANHLFADAHPRLRTTNTLWHLVLGARGRTLDDGIPYAEDLIENLGSPRFDLGLKLLGDVRSVHLLGGGYLNSVWEHQLLLLPALVRLKELSGVPIHATGQGLSPLEGTAPAAVPRWVRAFDTFETRDAPSAALLGASHGLDDAFLAFAGSRPVYSSAPSPEVMVLVQGDFVDGSTADALVEAVAGFVAARRTSRPVGLVESLPPDDSWMLSRLRERGLEVDFYPFVRLWEEGFPARRGQTWLSTRFHFHLLAAAAGARGAVIDLHPEYYGVKHDSLRELGTGWAYTSDLGEVAALTPTVDAGFARRCRRLASRKVAVAKGIYP